jgi:hypothetical protein
MLEFPGKKNMYVYEICLKYVSINCDMALHGKIKLVDFMAVKFCENNIWPLFWNS